MEFTNLFKKKEEVPAIQAKKRISMNDILDMRSKSLSNPQIVSYFQRDGYSMQEINDAMMQADIKGSVGGPLPNTGNQFSFPTQEQQPLQPWSDQQPPSFPEFNMQEPPQEMPLQQPQMALPPSQFPFTRTNQIVKEDVEEIAEAVVADSTLELKKQVNFISGWRDNAEERMMGIEQELSSLRKSQEILEEKARIRMDDFTSSLHDLTAQISGVKDVFQKIMPTMTSNVKQLSEIVENMKENTKTRKSSKQNNEEISQ